MRPSSVEASFSVTSGRPVVTRWRKPARTSAASSASTPSSTAIPAARSLATPWPFTRGSGSWAAITTRAMPAAIRASVQGACGRGGSRVPASRRRWRRAPPRPPWRAPAARRAAARRGAVTARPTTRPFCTMTQPTEGFGQVLPSPRRARARAARICARSSSIMRNDRPRRRGERRPAARTRQGNGLVAGRPRGAAYGPCGSSRLSDLHGGRAEDHGGTFPVRRVSAPPRSSGIHHCIPCGCARHVPCRRTRRHDSTLPQ